MMRNMFAYLIVFLFNVQIPQPIIPQQNYIIAKGVAVTMLFTAKLKNSVHDTLQYLFAHKKVLVILLFLLTVLIRTPNLLRDYASDDSTVMYMDIASNIKDGNGWRADHRFIYTDNTPEDDSIAHQMHETAPLYPLFLAGVFIFNQGVSHGNTSNVLFHHMDHHSSYVS